MQKDQIYTLKDTIHFTHIKDNPFKKGEKFACIAPAPPNGYDNRGHIMRHVGSGKVIEVSDKNAAKLFV